MVFFWTGLLSTDPSLLKYIPIHVGFIWGPTFGNYQLSSSYVTLSNVEGVYNLR